MSQYEIAKDTGISQTAVHYILNGDRSPSPKTAKNLERATGICREAWIWPERHWNPYIPFVKTSVCGSCPNRIHRIEKINAMCIDDLKKAEDKREAFNLIIKRLMTVVHGETSGQLVVFREILPDKLVLLAAGGNIRHGHNVLKGERWQGLIDAVQKRGVFSVPHWPHDIPDGNPAALMLYIEDPRSYYRFSSGRHIVFFVIATRYTMMYTPKILRAGQLFVDALDKIWHDAFYA